MPRHQRALVVVVVLRDARSLRDHLERHERFCDTSRRPLRRIRSHARVLAISRRVVRDVRRHRMGGWRRVSTTIRPQPSLKPAILVCTSKVVSPEQRKDYEAWLTEGKTLIDAVLKDKDCQAGLSVPAGRRPLPEGRFSWVHFPAAGGEAKPIRRGLKKSPPDSSENDRESLEHVRHSGAPNCETVAVVFQRQDDMERWTHSNRRAEWLKRGERFNGGDPDGALRARANVIMDDGSLGGWLPATPTGDSNHAPAVPSWKVYAAVVLAQYPIYELNMLLLLPGLEAAGEPAAWFTGATQPARGAVVQAWSSAMAVFGMLPLTQRLLRWYGFMGAKGVDGRTGWGHSRDGGVTACFGLEDSTSRSRT